MVPRNTQHAKRPSAKQRRRPKPLNPRDPSLGGTLNPRGPSLGGLEPPDVLVVVRQEGLHRRCLGRDPFVGRNLSKPQVAKLAPLLVKPLRGTPPTPHVLLGTVEPVDLLWVKEPPAQRLGQVRPPQRYKKPHDDNPEPRRPQQPALGLHEHQEFIHGNVLCVGHLLGVGLERHVGLDEEDIVDLVLAPGAPGPVGDNIRCPVVKSGKKRELIGW
mmetsp:Transcript_28412/g.71487  ORF Transcript_28412/g.71487 Transcript_28412/m.71487 type:complete len:215 (-) Transcript_28412:404-1048(-)